MRRFISIDGGAGAEALPLEALVGPAVVVDATSLEEDIDETALGTLDIPEGAERLIFKTRNCELWSEETFSDDFISFVESGAHRLVDSGVRGPTGSTTSSRSAADGSPPGCRCR